MKMSFLKTLAIIVPALCCFLSFTTCPHAQPTPDEIVKITAAAPAAATATPQRERKLLVFTRTEGFVHSSIPYGAKALEIIGQKTGTFEVVIRDDMAAFEKQNLEKFDAVCFVSTTQLKFEDEKYRNNLMDFVKSGKGVAGIHAATDNFYAWPEAAAMIGGLFDGHPWHGGGTWAVKIDDPEHPVAAAFQGEGFSINDELYRIKKPYSRENLRVLLSLNFDDEATNEAEGIRPNDVDVPVSWVRNFGKGRVFYSSLGHNPHVYWNPAVLQHYLDGIQFALGDLPADATPSLEVALTNVASYEYGQSRQLLTMIDNFIRFSQDSTEALHRLENRFLEILAANTTLAGKQFACEKLRMIGTEASVPVLVKMLSDSATVEMARYALEGIPGKAVNAVLRQALQNENSIGTIGIITTLGQRRDGQAVPTLKKLMYDRDVWTVAAAIAALGEIATPQAADLLIEASKNITDDMQPRLLDAYLVCADRLHDDGQSQKTLAMYKELYESNAPVEFRAAALRGLALAPLDRLPTGLADSANAGEIIMAAFRSETPEIRTEAIQLVSAVQDRQAARIIATELPNLPAESQVQLLTALSERGDPDLQNAAVQAIEHKQATVRIAALKALARLGDASSVFLLARYAITHFGAEAETARESLYRLRGENVDSVIVKNLATTDSVLKAEYIHACGERRIISSAPAVLAAANDPAPEVRLAAIRALRTIGDPSVLPEMVKLLASANQSNERRELELTVAAVAKKISDRNQRARAVLDAMPAAKTVTARASLLSVLGKIGDPTALLELRKYLSDNNLEIKSAAIRALSDWPDAEPQADLLAVTQSADNDIHRILALRGYVRLLGIDTTRTAEETVAKYRTAITLAHNAGEKKMVLSALAEIESPQALNMAAEFLPDSTLRQEAEVAILKIAQAIQGRNAPNLRPVLQHVADGTNSDTTRKQAQELIEIAVRIEDHITDWQVCGPFTKKNENLLNFAFAPETSEEHPPDSLHRGKEASLDWRAMPAETDPNNYWRLELDKVLGGDNRAAYLRTNVWSEQAQPARLELGSDDGVKVWLNGELAHTKDASRGVSPGDDVVEVTLKQGWNQLLLKVTNKGGGWGACARFRKPDGSRLVGLRVRAER